MKFVNFFKLKTKKQKIIFFTTISLIILIISGIFLLLSTKDDGPKTLTPFKILSFTQDVNNKQNMNLLKFEKSNNAVNYKIYVYNDKDKLINEQETKEQEIIIENIQAEYNDEITIKVVAIDKNGRKLKSSNELKINWALPSLQINEITDIGNDEDLSVRINMDESNMAGYYLILTKSEEEIIKIEVDSTKMIIPSNYYQNNLGKYKLSLVYDDLELSSYEFNVGLPEIGEVYIDSIKHNSTIPWDDFEITFSGGENANLYEISIFKDNKMIFFKQLTEMTYKMDITNLEENSTYVLKVMAYNRIDNTINNERVLSFKTSSKTKAESVTANIKSGEIYIGQTITLTTNTPNATIYYTINGENPTTSSLKYENPIEITKDVTIKAFVVSKNYFDSDIATFTYQAKEKPIKVYISPSINSENTGIAGSGFTNESAMMKKIFDVIKPKLENKGIIVYTQASNMSASDILKDSQSKKVDLHLTLKSNSKDGSTKGISTYVYSKSSKIAPLASKIQSKLESIYYETNSEKLYYGSETGNAFDEINPTKVNNGILIKIGYHDNMTDATWIANNINKIGDNLADAIITYYGK